MHTLHLDYVYNMEIQDFLSGLEQFRGKIIGFDAYGPAGGNPNISISFPTKALALAYLNQSYDPNNPDENEFLLNK